MFVIAGLGNPGSKYMATRHNIGFEVIERFAYDNNIKLNKKKFNAIIGEGRIDGEKVVLVQPQTYMNKSGESIKQIVDFYKVPLDNLIIVYDDISLELGVLRIRKKGSAGGHNGMKNIILHLGSQEFPRFRVGVGDKPPAMDLANYVLSRFSKQEIKEIVLAIEYTSNALKIAILDGIDSAMNSCNHKSR